MESSVARSFPTIPVLITFLNSPRSSNELSMPILNEFRSENSGVEIRIKKINTLHTNLYTKRAIQRKYQPLELTIINRTSSPLCLSKNNFSLGLEPVKRVARRLHNSVMLSVLPGIALSVLSTAYVSYVTSTSPVVAFFALGAMILLTTTFPLLNILGVASYFIIPPYLTNRDNDIITRRFKESCTDLEQKLTIPAHNGISKMIYIKKTDFIQPVNIKLTSTLSNTEISFDMDLN